MPPIYDMQQHSTDPAQDGCFVKDIAERMLAHHTDGTVIATAEALGLDLQKGFFQDLSLFPGEDRLDNHRILSQNWVECVCLQSSWLREVLD